MVSIEDLPVLGAEFTFAETFAMQLQSIPVVEHVDAGHFKQAYYQPQKPVVIRDLARQWPAYSKWNWDYFRQLAGHQKVSLYNNSKSDAYTPINKADDYKTFGEYIDMVSKGPAEWRIFLFNIFDHAPPAARRFQLARPFNERVCKKVSDAFCGRRHFHYPYAF